MELTPVHLVTRWCALLSKVHKGIGKCLSHSLTLTQYRILLQLGLPESFQSSCNCLAYALVIKPADVQGAAERLLQIGYISRDNAGLLCLEQAGAEICDKTSARVRDFLEKGHTHIQASDREFVAESLKTHMNVPGSFFVRSAIPIHGSDELPLAYWICSYVMYFNTLEAIIKADLHLSFTDFRFLLELAPKRRIHEKYLRAKDIVTYLRVGRAYVSTASVRLEEHGLIQRIPDPDDARGILFTLTPTGLLAVQEVCDDILAIHAGTFALEAHGSCESTRIMRAMLKGYDEALERFDD